MCLSRYARKVVLGNVLETCTFSQSQHAKAAANSAEIYLKTGVEAAEKNRDANSEQLKT